MGINNTAAVKWLGNKQRFADLFNGTIYQGKQVIHPDDLQELRNESDFIFLNKEQKIVSGQRYRDLIMLWKNEFALSLLACENQHSIHYAMPLRTMLYDSLSYLEQAQRIWDRYRFSANQKKAPLTHDEFLSHFRKEDRLIPIITIVFYYGTEPWDASLDLHGMLNLPVDDKITHPLLETYIPNYKLNLIDASNEKHLERFETDLQVLFQMLQCKKNTNKLCHFMKQKKDYFQVLSSDDAIAMSEFLEFPKMRDIVAELKAEQEEPDMCKALQDLYNDGVTDGYLFGQQYKLTQLVEKFYRRGFPVEEIAEFLDESTDTINGIIESLPVAPQDIDPIKSAGRFHERYGI